MDGNETRASSIAPDIEPRERSGLKLRFARPGKKGLVDGAVGISRDVTEQKTLEAELAALATTDALTGLGNRREFDRKLETEWLRARREQTNLSLIMIDVDHFKQFNDTYGHVRGDNCLRMIGRFLASRTKRPADLALRYGGEEFTVILPNTDADGCAMFAEELRAGIEGLSIAHGAHPSSKVVTISVGAAAMMPGNNGLQADYLIAAADRAPYESKRNRNRVVVAAEIVTLQRETAGLHA